MAKCKYLELNWIKDMTDSLVMMHPEMSRDEIEDFVIEEYHQHYTDHDCMIYNNYENTVANMTLGTVVDWFETEQPLIAESGVFFYQKSKKRNLNVEIIKECMLDARTIHKKEMFDALDKGDTFTATVKNIQQLNDKKAANSGYGAEGQSSSFLFNVHSAMSVTASGRAQLSTAMNCYENLFGDFVKFFNMDEFHRHILHIVREQDQWEFATGKIIERVPTKKEWVQRFESKFLHQSLYNHEEIEAVYDGLDPELRIRTFYKTNLRILLKWNRKPLRMLDEIVSTSEDFIDPNKPPKEIKDKLQKFIKLIMEFVNMRYSVFRYEDRARYQKRSTVVVMDTDSNMLNYGPLLNFIKGILPTRVSRKEKYKGVMEAFDLKILNVISCCASAGIAETLWNYLGYIHVEEDDRKYIKMKNEFYYSRLIVTYAMKSYIALLKRREEVVLKKPELDVKGVNFFKSTASKKTSDFIYDKVLMGELFRDDGNISLRSTYKTIMDFQRQIKTEIGNGEMGFLRQSVKVKSADAYADPMKIGQYKSVFVWNYVNEKDEDRIDLPAITTSVKVQLRDKKDVAKLAPWPHIYKKMMELFETNKDIGDYTIIKDGKERRVKGKGIKSIALPNEYEKVPDWLLAIIDVETIASDNLGLMGQIFAPLGMTPGKATHNGATLRYYSNIVKL